MAADKVPSITKSALSNDNRRTVLHAILGPGATTYPHYHTIFSETFTLLKGPLTVYTSPDISEASLEAKTLEVGESVTIPPKQLHYFLAGEGEVTVTMTFEPGVLDLERAMMIMRGTQRDGTYQGYNDIVFMAVLGELTNSTGVGETKKMLDELYASRRDEIQVKKTELLEKYASDEQLRKGGNE
jgi:quercetin dioxygenase-like cupin family protein